MSRYVQRHDGEGFSYPAGVPWKIACCDCGLVHKIVIVVKGVRKGSPVGIAVKRDNRATAARRRNPKFSGHGR
jgi:hypothetical protein